MPQSLRRKFIAELEEEGATREELWQTAIGPLTYTRPTENPNIVIVHVMLNKKFKIRGRESRNTNISTKLAPRGRALAKALKT